MKIPVIKKLVENHSLEELTQAESAIAEGQTPIITIEGEDEGEMLTHAFAAMYVSRLMNEQGLDFNKALREYTKMVRDAIN